MSGPVVVINPNSNAAVTEALDAALDPWRLPGGPAVECLTLEEGPFGVESQRDGDAVIGPLLRLVEARPNAGAFVIACYSDPGLESCREATSVPVLGIGDVGVLTALARADLFGVISISSGAVGRHRRAMRRMGVLDRCAGDFALDMSVDETARGEGTLARLEEMGGTLAGRGAGALVLGCAGMARHRAPLEAALGIPVIDPTQAAVTMALGALLSERRA